MFGDILWYVNLGGSDFVTVDVTRHFPLQSCGPTAKLDFETLSLLGKRSLYIRSNINDAAHLNVH